MKKWNINLSDEEKIDWLRLYRSENIGSRSFFDFLKVFGAAREALQAIPNMAKRGGSKREIKICSYESAQDELTKARKFGAEIIAYCEPQYPAILRHIPDAPPVISVLGDAGILTNKTVGVVGSRNSSANSSIFAGKISSELGKAGYVVASGLARGIDTHAHKGSLKTGTIGVIAGGIDNIYPPENEKLYKEIVENNGAIISELPFGTVPRAQNFPQRNRIIAGISLGVLVVEAALKSGSLITAKLALDYNREVFAVPGSPFDPRCQGTNSLLKKGAILTESIEDIVSALNFMSNRQDDLFSEKQMEFQEVSQKTISQPDLDKYRDLIIEKLSATPIDIDELARQVEAPINAVIAIILELELAERVTRHAGNKVSLLFS